MASPVPPPPPVDARVEDPRRQRGPVQFSLKALLVVMTVVAVLCAVTTALPTSVALMMTGALWIAGAGWLASGVLFARGDRQAFCLGGMIVIASMWTQSGGRLLEGVRTLLRPLGMFGLGAPLTPWLELALVAAAAAGNGWLCVRARRWHQSADE